MPEIAFITQLKDEPIALVVLGGMVFYKIMAELIKHILPLLTKKKPVEKLLAEDAQDRKIWRADVETKLGEIEASVDKIFSALADHEEFANKISQGTLENQLFNESLSAFKRLKAFLRLIAMRVNGRIREKGFALVLQNKEVWRDVLEAHIELKIVDQKYFDEVLADIDRKIFDY